MCWGEAGHGTDSSGDNRRMHAVLTFEFFLFRSPLVPLYMFQSPLSLCRPFPPKVFGFDAGAKLDTKHAAYHYIPKQRNLSLHSPDNHSQTAT